MESSIKIVVKLPEVSKLIVRLGNKHVRYIATDSNGGTFGYISRPYFYERMEVWVGDVVKHFPDLSLKIIGNATHVRNAGELLFKRNTFSQSSCEFIRCTGESLM